MTSEVEQRPRLVTADYGWHGSQWAKTKSYLEQQILKISAELDKSFSKYLFSKAKITHFEKETLNLQ